MKRWITLGVLFVAVSSPACRRQVKTTASSHDIVRDVEEPACGTPVVPPVISDLKIRRDLVDASMDPDYRVRSLAIEKLARLGSRSESALLRRLTSDPESHIRLQAATALAKLKSTAAIDGISHLLRTKCWADSDEAAILLRSFASAAVPALVAMLKDPDDDARELAADSLGVIKDPRAAQPLIETLLDANDLVRSAAATSLGRIGEPAGTSLLAAAQNTAEPNRAARARWALRFLEGSPTQDPIIDLENNREPDAARNRLRNYLRSTAPATGYAELVKICGPSFCLERYEFPTFPRFLPPGPDDLGWNKISRVAILSSGKTEYFDVEGVPISIRPSRQFEVTLSIEGDGKVSSVQFDDPRMNSSELAKNLQSWKFGNFVPGLTYPVRHRLVVELTNSGRPRYPYGRPYVELDLNRVRMTTHVGLSYIN